VRQHPDQGYGAQLIHDNQTRLAGPAIEPPWETLTVRQEAPVGSVEISLDKPASIIMSDSETVLFYRRV